MEQAEEGPASPGSSEGSKENRQEEDEEEQVKIKFPCPECKKSFTAVKTVFKHMVKFHDMDMQEAKTHRKEIKAGMIKIKKRGPGRPGGPVECPRCWKQFKNNSNLSVHLKCSVDKCQKVARPGPRLPFTGVASPIRRINAYVRMKKLSRDSVRDIIERDLRRGRERSESPGGSSRRSSVDLDEIIADREAREKEESIPREVEAKISELINRRSMQCNVCQQKFNRSAGLKRHAASLHLELERWRCTVCDFRSWTREECVRHAAGSHRLRSGDLGVEERRLEDYFGEHLAATGPGETVAVGLNGGTAAGPEAEEEGDSNEVSFNP